MSCNVRRLGPPRSAHRTLLPGLTSLSVVSRLSTPSSSVAASTMPCEISPRNLTGFKLATMTTRRPTSCFGIVMLRDAGHHLPGLSAYVPAAASAADPPRPPARPPALARPAGRLAETWRCRFRRGLTGGRAGDPRLAAPAPPPGLALARRPGRAPLASSRRPPWPRGFRLRPLGTVRPPRPAGLRPGSMRGNSGSPLFTASPGVRPPQRRASSHRRPRPGRPCPAAPKCAPACARETAAPARR